MIPCETGPLCQRWSNAKALFFSFSFSPQGSLLGSFVSSSTGNSLLIPNALMNLEKSSLLASSIMDFLRFVLFLGILSKHTGKGKKRSGEGKDKRTTMELEWVQPAKKRTGVIVSTPK